jgi:acyl-coenzyme A synthetase/AMP-(fatty) acid ligase
MICSMPGAIPLKPGVAGRPFFGVNPVVVKMDGSEADLNEDGMLLIKDPWPGMARTIYGDPKRYYETYFSQYKGFYFTGDGAAKDEDGDFHLKGRRRGEGRRRRLPPEGQDRRRHQRLRPQARHGRDRERNRDPSRRG